MFFDRFTPAIPGQILPDPKADYHTAEKVGPCRISEQAVYLVDRRYILRSAIKEVQVGMGCAHVTGCCAGGVPVPRVVFVTAAAKFPVLCDKEATAQRIAAMLQPDGDR